MAVGVLVYLVGRCDWVMCRSIILRRISFLFLLFLFMLLDGWVQVQRHSSSSRLNTGGRQQLKLRFHRNTFFYTLYESENGSTAVLQ